MKKFLMLPVILSISLGLSGCSSQGEGNEQACEQFQLIMNKAYLVGEDVILDGSHYSEDLKNKVIPLADKDLTLALVKMLSIMEQTNQGSTEEMLRDLQSSHSTLYDACKAAGIELAG